MKKKLSLLFALFAPRGFRFRPPRANKIPPTSQLDYNQRQGLKKSCIVVTLHCLQKDIFRGKLKLSSKTEQIIPIRYGHPVDADGQKLRCWRRKNRLRLVPARNRQIDELFKISRSRRPSAKFQTDGSKLFARPESSRLASRRRLRHFWRKPQRSKNVVSVWTIEQQSP